MAARLSILGLPLGTACGARKLKGPGSNYFSTPHNPTHRSLAANPLLAYMAKDIDLHQGRQVLQLHATDELYT